ncbi:MAG: hypothetical protein ACK4WJ_02155 [Endomicrobiia bacterium]
MERRKFDRRPIIAEATLISSKSSRKIPVWVRNVSVKGMRITFYKTFCCENCEFYPINDYNICKKKNNCEIYELKKVIEIISQGKICTEIEGKKIEHQYEVKWYKVLDDSDMIDFGIQFLD